MSARGAAAWSAACLSVVLTTSHPLYRTLVLAATVTVLVGAAGPGRAARVLVAAGVAGVLAAVFNLLLSHLGGDVLFSLPDWLPAVGGPYTLEAAVFGLSAGVTLAAALLAVVPFAVLLETDQVLDALPSFLHSSGAAVAAATNLAPGLGRTLRAVTDAQRLRGWRPRGPRSWSEVLIPVLLTAIEDSIQLAESMEARAFGSGRRTRLEPPRMARQDWATVGAAAAAVAVFVVALLTGMLAAWDAYPFLRWPSVSLLPVAACLLLALPAVWWRSPLSPA